MNSKIERRPMLMIKASVGKEIGGIIAQNAEKLGAGEILITSIDADGTKNGYDDIALTLKKDAKINIFEKNKKNLTPWLY